MDRAAISADRYRDYVTCPYNPSHSLPPNRVHYHLLKCRAQHPGVDLTPCPYNATHLMRPGEEDDHIRTCRERQEMEIRMYGLTTPVPGAHGNLTGPTVFGSDLILQGNNTNNDADETIRSSAAGVTPRRSPPRPRFPSPAGARRGSYDDSLVNRVRRNLGGGDTGGHDTTYGAESLADDRFETLSAAASAYSRPASAVNSSPSKQHITLTNYADEEDDDKTFDAQADLSARLSIMALSRHDERFEEEEDEDPQDLTRSETASRMLVRSMQEMSRSEPSSQPGRAYDLLMKIKMKRASQMRKASRERR